MTASRLRALLLFSLLLTAPLLTGCLGGGSDASDEKVQKQRADVNAQLGGIEGVVTDTAVQPIEGANVTIAELNRTVRTSADGSFAFSLIEPGTYTVAVGAPGIVSSQEIVSVRANAIATVDFIVSLLVSDQPFTQAIEFSAFFECGVGAGHSVENPGAPAWLTGITWATCATLNFGGNATNDRFSTPIRLEPPIESMVWEARWDTSGNALAKNLWLVADVQGHAGLTAGNHTVHVNYSTPSPFLVQVDRPHFDDIAAYFKAKCESTDDDADTFCGYNFDDVGWPITVRTFTATDCLDLPASACAPLQLKVDHVFTGFYNAPAPAGYSVYGGA